MKRNGLTKADDFTQEWAKAADQRTSYYAGKTGAITRDDIGRAIHQLESRKDKR
jgi:hypothetical protein